MLVKEARHKSLHIICSHYQDILEKTKLQRQKINQELPGTEGREGFPGGSEVKASACHVGDPGSMPGSGRSPGEGNGKPLQYSCLENPMDRGARQATSPWGRKESDMTLNTEECKELFWSDGKFLYLDVKRVT